MIKLKSDQEEKFNYALVTLHGTTRTLSKLTEQNEHSSIDLTGGQ